MIILNFKIYRETFGDGALELAKICQSVARKRNIKIIPAVSALDVYRIKHELDMEVLVESVDPYEEGARSGYISPVAAQMAGAMGAIINHSEHKLKPGTIKSILKKWPKDFKSVVCLQTTGQAESWAKNIKADIIAYEPSYLIGSKDKSVSTDEVKSIEKFVKFYPNIPVLVGAGVKSTKDVQIALSLGAKGVLVSSAIVTAADPEKELLELSAAF